MTILADTAAMAWRVLGPRTNDRVENAGLLKRKSLLRQVDVGAAEVMPPSLASGCIPMVRTERRQG
jgi:hypothetical protein